MISTQTQKILFLQTQPLCCVVIENTNIYILLLFRASLLIISQDVLQCSKHCLFQNLTITLCQCFYCLVISTYGAILICQVSIFFIASPITRHGFFFLQYEKAIPCLSECRKISQPAFSCSKLTTEALEQGVKYVPS